MATSNKGYATTEILDLQGVRDLFEFRLLIEPWAARTAAANRLNNPAQILDDELADFDAGADSLQHALIAHDSRFHRAILEAADNHTVFQAFEQSHCHLHLFRMYGQNWDWRATIEEHKSISEAIRAAEPTRAEDMMRLHLQRAYMRFFGAMTEHRDGPAELRASVSPKLIID